MPPRKRRTKSQTVDGSLCFKMGEFEDSLNALQALATNFLARNSEFRIQDLRDGLLAIASSNPGEKKYLFIDEANPIITNVSTDFEHSGKTSHEIQADIFGIWEMTPIGRPSGQPRQRIISFSGMAKCQVNIFDVCCANERKLVSSWSMEIGDSNSPGSYFHSQIKLDSGKVFPSWLPIPRLPFIPATPMAAIEFTLGELFQDTWESSTLAGGWANDKWTKTQRTMLEAWLKEQITWISEGEGSVWMRLKKYKPQSDLLLA